MTTKFDPADYDAFSCDGYSISDDSDMRGAAGGPEELDPGRAEFRAHYTLAGPSSRLTFVETVRWHTMVRRLIEELRGQGKAPAADVQDALLATSSRHFVPPHFHGTLNALA